MRPGLIQEDAWAALRSFTDARIALGRAGTALPLEEVLKFKLAHAHARDAVYSSLDTEGLLRDLAPFGLPAYVLHSMAGDRHTYLQRPDLGRSLDAPSVEQLREAVTMPADLCIVIADGLSATAVNRHALSLLEQLVPSLRSAGLTLAPFTLLQQGRVAAGDTIGSLLRARLSVLLIGERPGLSAADSMGAYLTFRPLPGLTDDSRNCISNIRPEGLNFTNACIKLIHLIREALRLGLSGVFLKDTATLLNER
jgi:ethanolamine ammonia-lyase small subunit